MKREQSAKAAPWYREPWPWLLMLGPLIVIIAGVITAYLAVVTSDGLVEDCLLYTSESCGKGVSNGKTTERRGALRSVVAALLLLAAGAQTCLLYTSRCV